MKDNLSTSDFAGRKSILNGINTGGVSHTTLYIQLDDKLKKGLIDAPLHAAAIEELDVISKGGKKAFEGEERKFGPNIMKKVGDKWVYVRRAGATESTPKKKEETTTTSGHKLQDFKEGDKFHGKDLYGNPAIGTITRTKTYPDGAYEVHISYDNGDKMSMSTAFGPVWKEWRKIDPSAKSVSITTTTKPAAKFDRGEAHHAQNVEHHTKQQKIQEEVHNDLKAKHKEIHDKYGEKVAEPLLYAVATHERKIQDHKNALKRLDEIKKKDGLLSVTHLKVGDKFMATYSSYEGDKKNGQQIPIRITKVSPNGVTYITEDGYETSIDNYGQASGYLTNTNDFTKWKPINSSAATKSEYEDLSPKDLLKKVGINNVSSTEYSGKRSTVYDKKTTYLDERNNAIEKIRSLVMKNGKPDKVTYESYDTSIDNRDMEYAAYAEHEFSYHKGTSVILHWGDKKEKI